MKILSLSCIPLLPYYGSGYTRLHWTNGLRNLGHTVDVLEPKDFELWATISKAKKYRQALGLLLTVRKLLRTQQYDIIEFYGDEYWLLLLWLKKIKKSSILLVAHADGLELLDMEKEQLYWNKRKGISKWLDDNTRKRFSRLTFKLADKFVCGCNDDLHYVLKKNYFTTKNAVCIAPGIEDSFHKILFAEKKEKIILFLGSWIKRKAIQIIPEVVSDILLSHQDYSFHVYGAWHSKNQILNAFDLKISDRVFVFDKLPKEKLLKGILQSAILFFPSYSEGFGLATVEAMSCSCAVVTTKTGIGSQLTNYDNAIICDFNDKPGMIRVLNELIGDEILRERIALNGYKKSKEYNWSDQVNELEKIYFLWYTEQNM